MNVNQEFSKNYKGFRTSSSIENDIKLIKKLNNLISKWKKTNKDMYKLEIFNIFQINENIFMVDHSFIEKIKSNFIEPSNIKVFNDLYVEYHEFI